MKLVRCEIRKVAVEFQIQAPNWCPQCVVYCQVGGVMTKLISRNTVILGLMFWPAPDWWMFVSHGYRINHPITAF